MSNSRGHAGVVVMHAGPAPSGYGAWRGRDQGLRGHSAAGQGVRAGESLLLLSDGQSRPRGCLLIVTCLRPCWHLCAGVPDEGHVPLRRGADEGGGQGAVERAHVRPDGQGVQALARTRTPGAGGIQVRPEQPSAKDTRPYLTCLPVGGGEGRRRSAMTMCCGWYRTTPTMWHGTTAS